MPAMSGSASKVMIASSGTVQFGGGEQRLIEADRKRRLSWMLTTQPIRLSGKTRLVAVLLIEQNLTCVVK